MVNISDGAENALLIKIVTL